MRSSTVPIQNTLTLEQRSASLNGGMVPGGGKHHKASLTCVLLTSSAQLKAELRTVLRTGHSLLAEKRTQHLSTITALTRFMVGGLGTSLCSNRSVSFWYLSILYYPFFPSLARFTLPTSRTQHGRRKMYTLAHPRFSPSKNCKVRPSRVDRVRPERVVGQVWVGEFGR